MDRHARLLGWPWKLHDHCNIESRLNEQVWIKVLSTRHPPCMECQQAAMQSHMHASNLPCSSPSLCCRDWECSSPSLCCRDWEPNMFNTKRTKTYIPILSKWLQTAAASLPDRCPFDLVSKDLRIRTRWLSPLF